MSVGTNENENIKKIQEDVKVINTGENVDKGAMDVQATQCVDMQATQRIVILDELKKDTEDAVKKLFENSSSEISAEPIAQQETKTSNSEFSEKTAHYLGTFFF